MDDDTVEALVEVKTKLLAAPVESLMEVAGKLLPDFAKDASRAKTILALDTFLSDLAKEENAVVKMKKIISDIDVKPGAATKPTTVAEEAGGKTVSSDREIHLRKDFKVHGSIGEGKSCLGYMSFLRQIQSGVSHGYTERDIVDGVIKAIQGGSRLRGYLEGCEDLTLPSLQAIVWAFYKERSATELYQELCGLKQYDRETTQEFVFRALELRQKILFASKENPSLNYNKDLVEQSFRHSVSTGVRDENIRLECRQLLQEYKNDEALIQGVNEIVRRADETRCKLSKPVRVNQVGETEECTILKELKSLRADLNELKLGNKGKPQTEPFNNQRFPKRCRICDPSTRCIHCWECGQSGHIQRNCPGNANGVPQRGGR